MNKNKMTTSIKTTISELYSSLYGFLLNTFPYITFLMTSPQKRINLVRVGFSRENIRIPYQLPPY